MTDAAVLAQARQGDVIAIAYLLNQSLCPQGIWARVEPIAQGLSITLESTSAPSVALMEQHISAGLSKLRPQGITDVILQGFALGEAEPVWVRKIVLASTSVDNVVPQRSAIAAPVPLLPRPTNQAERRPNLSLPMVSPPVIRQVGHPPKHAFTQSPRRDRSAQPWVIKWSDFDPMMLAIIGFVAVYGFLGARNPSYDGPFIWLHYPDLAIHETGHLLFMPFGYFLMLLGGSLTQIAFPAVFTSYFYGTQQYFSSALTLFWTGQNFMDVAVYMADAPYRALPLTNPNIDAHDWWQLFNMMNCLNQAELIAGITHWLGVLLYVAAVVVGIYVAYQHQQAIQERRSFAE